MQVSGEVQTIEIPDETIKKWWPRDDFKTFVQDFKERHPLVKDLAKKKAGSEGAGDKLVVAPLKRAAPVDFSGQVVDVANAPSGTVLAEVPMMTFRFPPDVKGADPPQLVVTDQGPFIRNTSGHPVTGLNLS